MPSFEKIKKELIDGKIKKELIGQGGYGQVYKFKYEGLTYALKQIALENFDKNGENILKILYKINNENIVKYYDSFENDNKINIIMEYAGDTNLQKLIQKHISKDLYFEKEELNNIISQICNGLKGIHENNIIHRDITSVNIFFDAERKKIKIGDFGLSKTGSTLYSITGRGTVEYMAPELIKNQKYSNKVDIYGLGCIFYELFTLHKYHDDKMIDDVRKVDSHFYDEKWQKLINKRC